VLYTRGVPDVSDVFKNARWAGTVKVETYANREFAGEAKASTQRAAADWKYSQWGEAGEPRSVRYSAAFRATAAGKYDLVTASNGNDIYKVAGRPARRSSPRPTKRARHRRLWCSISPPGKPFS